MAASKHLAFVVAAALSFSANLAIAQTMGEYGGVTAHAAGAGASASTIRPPEVHGNHVTSRGATKTYEVTAQVREDDSAGSANERDHDSAKDDDWEQVK